MEKEVVKKMDPRALLESKGCMQQGDFYILGRRAWLLTDAGQIVSYRYDHTVNKFLYAAVLNEDALYIQLECDINF